MLLNFQNSIPLIAVAEHNGTGSLWTIVKLMMLSMPSLKINVVRELQRRFLCPVSWAWAHILWPATIVFKYY